MFRSVKLTKNADPDIGKYNGYRIGLDSCWKNVILLGADMCSSVHIDNKDKDILIFSEGPTQELDDTTLTAEAKYPINFTQSNRKFCLSFH